MTITVAEAWISAEDVERNFTNFSNTQKLRAANMLNHEIYGVVMDTAPDRLITTQAISVTTGLNTVALPSDFDNLTSEGSGIFQLDTNSNPSSELPIIVRGNNSSGSNTTEGFYIQGTDLIIQSNSDQNLTMYYIPELDEMTNVGLSDTFAVVTKKYLEMMQMGILVQWAKMQRETVRQNNYSVQFNALKSSFIDELERKSNVSQIPIITY